MPIGHRRQKRQGGERHTVRPYARECVAHVILLGALRPHKTLPLVRASAEELVEEEAQPQIQRCTNFELHGSPPDHRDL